MRRILFALALAIVIGMAIIGSSAAFAELRELPKAACPGIDNAFTAQSENPSSEDFHSSVQDLKKTSGC